MDVNIRGYYDRGVFVVIWNSFFGKFVYPVGGEEVKVIDCWYLHFSPLRFSLYKH